MSEHDPNKAAVQPPVDMDVVYPCIGVCMADPETGLCQGCGRPLAEPEPQEADDPT